MLSDLQEFVIFWLLVLPVLFWFGSWAIRAQQNFLLRSPRLAFVRERLPVLFDTPRQRSLLFLAYIGCSTSLISYWLLANSSNLGGVYGIFDDYYGPFSGEYGGKSTLPSRILRFFDVLKFRGDFDAMILQIDAQNIARPIGLMAIVPVTLFLLVEQTARDRLAAEVLANIQDSSLTTKTSFVLFLRPFSSTGQLQAPSLFASPFSLRINTYELEDYFASALKNIGPMVALGKPGENVGAGRVYVAEEDWHNKFILLARTASVILILPSSRAGTLWEISWLKSNGMFRKCIYVMPPEKTRTQYWVNLWQEATTELSKEGITLPEYKKKGALFTFDVSGKVAAVQQVSFRFRIFFRRSVLQILQNLNTRQQETTDIVYSRDQLPNSSTDSNSLLQVQRPRSITILSLCNLLLVSGYAGLMISQPFGSATYFLKPLNQWLFVLLSLAGIFGYYHMRYWGLFLHGTGTLMLGWHLIILPFYYFYGTLLYVIPLFCMGLILMIVGSFNYERMTRSF
ncbi:membrane hypothetical protein [Candidatus Nitrospira nitrosa]|uniref:Uncharacterized protein n=1 Tax=Candidatus Nitrospira nitrosa TaxID=1742972 RepID=A0A0S4L7F1_9BACT|nr:hypothetical protein [Candidatus Nitrospira nitrosa]CUS33135.1 membrane hypothetical protein [Candidatus Nitrospira nitrosa]